MIRIEAVTIQDNALLLMMMIHLFLTEGAYWTETPRVATADCPTSRQPAYDVCSCAPTAPQIHGVIIITTHICTFGFRTADKKNAPCKIFGRVMHNCILINKFSRRAKIAESYFLMWVFFWCEYFLMWILYDTHEYFDWSINFSYRISLQ